MSEYDPNNVFAKILAKEIPADVVYESEHALAFRDIAPAAPSHVLVVPKGRYRSIADFGALAKEEEIVGFFRAVSAVAKQLGLEETGYRLLANHGDDANQEVPHFHVHVVGGRNLGRLLPDVASG